MQAPISLRVGVHIEQETTLTLVQDMLSSAGHYSLIDPPGERSLAAYLEIVLDQVRQAPSSPYDLLILGGAEADALTNGAVLLRLSRLLALLRLPIMVLTNAQTGPLQAWQEFEQVVVLPVVMPSGLFSRRLFSQELRRLTRTKTSRPTPGFGPVKLGTLEEQQDQLRAEEHRRVEVRKHWLDQRQEWIDQRNTWLDQRQAWLEARGREQDPQHEWLAEQQVWLAQQRREVEDQHRKVNDLRRWLNRYQRRIDEDPPMGVNLST